MSRGCCWSLLFIHHTAVRKQPKQCPDSRVKVVVQLETWLNLSKRWLCSVIYTPGCTRNAAYSQNVTQPIRIKVSSQSELRFLRSDTNLTDHIGGERNFGQANPGLWAIPKCHLVGIILFILMHEFHSEGLLFFAFEHVHTNYLLNSLVGDPINYNGHTSAIEKVVQLLPFHYLNTTSSGVICLSLERERGSSYKSQHSVSTPNSMCVLVHYASHASCQVEQVVLHCLRNIHYSTLQWRSVGEQLFINIANSMYTVLI